MWYLLVRVIVSGVEEQNSYPELLSITTIPTIANPGRVSTVLDIVWTLPHPHQIAP